MPIEIPISKSVRSSGSTNWPPFIGPASFGWTGHVGFIHDVLKREYLAGYPRPGAATGRRVMPAHRGTHVGAGFLPARTLRVGNQDVRASRAQVGNLRLRGRSKSKAQVGKPAATGTASEASAPRDTRRCRFFTCTNATGRKPRRVREQDAGRKPAATGRQGAGGAKAGGAKAKAQVGKPAATGGPQR